MSAKKTPEKIVHELRQSPDVFLNYWSDHDDDGELLDYELLDEPKIIMDGAFTLEQLRAIVAVREKQLGWPDPIQEAARKCAKIVRNACAFEDWQEQGYDAAEQIEREFGVRCKHGS